MSRKDYEAIAGAFARTKPDANIIGKTHYATCLSQWKVCVKQVAYAFACDNRRFDYDRFYGACGYERD